MAFLRNAVSMASVVLVACSPQGQTDESASEPVRASSLAAQPDYANSSAMPTNQAKNQTVVMTRNLKPDAIKAGKPLPHKRIELKRGQRIDVLDEKGMSSFVGPVTIGPDGQTVSGGGGQEGVQGFGMGRDRIIQIGGVRVDSPSAASTESAMPDPPPDMPLPRDDPPK